MRTPVRIIRLVASVGPLPSLGKIRAAELRPILASDKKARAGRVRGSCRGASAAPQWGLRGSVARRIAHVCGVAGDRARRGVLRLEIGSRIMPVSLSLYLYLRPVATDNRGRLF